MAVPRSKTGWAERVLVSVEQSAGSGKFEVDDRLRAETAESMSDGEMAEARVAVRTDAAFTVAEGQARYHPDRRMIIHTREAVLFDGYPVASRLLWSGRQRRRKGEFVLTLEHVSGRMGRDEGTRIVGRHARDRAIEDGLLAGGAQWKAAASLITGLPCVFNMDGVGNCDPTPLELEDGNGGVRKIHIFSEDGGFSAIRWTFARALRFLLHFHNRKNYPVDTSGLLEVTDALADLSEEGREALLGRDDLGYSLLGRAETLAVESASLLEALSLFSAASGVRFAASSERVGQGVRTRLRMYTARSGRLRELRLAPAGRDAQGNPLYDTASKSATDLFEDNNLSAAELSWDAREVSTIAVVVGDVKRFELQADLMPGWLPEADLDNVGPSARSNAKSAALTAEQVTALGPTVADDPWYRKYHRGGADFVNCRRVGRLWVVNEAGGYGDAEYARNAPFDSYTPFDFSVLEPGPWMRRRRRFFVSEQPPEIERQVRVEVSFDGGTSWSEIVTGYSVLPDECAIWFDAPNLLSIAPGPGSAANLWYALVDQTFRVRVRAMIESDQRLMARHPAANAPTSHRSETVLYAPDRFRFLKQSTDESGSVVGQSNTPDRDDSALMLSVARSLASANGARAIVGQAVVPWLDTDYRVGDRIATVRGRGVDFAAERAPSERHACVVGKRYRFGPDRFETELLLSPAEGVRRRNDVEG